MALSGDSAQPIFIDSTYRNRLNYPLPSDFVSVNKPVTDRPNDPVGNGFILYKDVVGVLGYTPGTPGYVELATGIPNTSFENRFLNQYIEIVNQVAPFNTIARSVVIGFSTGTPITNLFVNSPLLGIAAGNLVFIRQFTANPFYRFVALGTAIGINTITIVGGLPDDDAYMGMYIRDVSILGTSYYISAYTGATTVATIAPAVIGTAITVGDMLEIYATRENEPGMTNPGSMFAKTNMVNHEVQLEWIRIPRHPLFVNEVTHPPAGILSMPKTINQFAYLMVMFHNLNNGSRGVIQTNAPNVRDNAQFIVPVEDLSNDVGKFFTMHSARAITIKFNPSEPIRFGLYLPDGTPVRFDPDDETGASLMIANPDLQISALFTVRRKL